MQNKKFYQLYKEGKLILDDIDDYVERWHNLQTGDGDEIEELHEYLGMTEKEYDEYLTSQIKKDIK